MMGTSMTLCQENRAGFKEDGAVCGFRSNSITDSGASRSLIPIQPDH